MFHISKNIIIILSILVLISCENLVMDELKNTPQNNFEVLWKTIDEKYSFLVDKKIDWNQIKQKYQPKIHSSVSVLEEFDVYKNMLFELKDGHVNLFSGFDVSRNWNWYLGYPSNFNSDIVEREYLGNKYMISGGLKHVVLKDNNTKHPAKKYGYVYYKSFSNTPTYINFVIDVFNTNKVKGIILDVRNNGGGRLAYAKELANRFADKKRLGFIEYYKIGKGHNDFSKGYKYYCERKSNYKIYTKPVIVLTNRKCYSATSFFVTMMKEFPNVTVIGDKTGGGSGLPVDFALPNGWEFRFSTTKTTDPKGYNFEFGVIPDKFIELKKTDEQKNVDTLIEEAKNIIDNQS